MSIRPMDLQVAVQRTAEVGRAHGNDTNRPLIAQQQFASEMQKQTQRENRKVATSHKTEGEPLNKDKEKGSKRSRGRQDGAHQEKKAAKLKTHKVQHRGYNGSMFDISI